MTWPKSLGVLTASRGQKVQFVAISLRRKRAMIKIPGKLNPTKGLSSYSGSSRFDNGKNDPYSFYIPGGLLCPIRPCFLYGPHDHHLLSLSLQGPDGTP